MSQSQSSATILVVDDDSGIREALTDILEDEGYAVRSASDGQAALDLLRQQTEPPALVLLDLMMPRMNGWQFRSEQRRDPALADIPVVVISASANIHDQVHALDAAAFIPKPIEYDRLVGVVERYCS